ncbi:MAG: glycosyltransferase family 2 protein [bacterium]
MNNQIVYSVVVPVYNEKEVLSELYKRMTSVMDKLGEPYEIVFVNDGSNDGSLELMKTLYSQDSRVKIINFSRNFGHQIAITAGLDYASGEAVITIDADLQDPPEVIPSLIDKWKEGFDVAYGIREKRAGESFFKLSTASVFYRFLGKITDTNIPADTGDFRLMSRKVVDSLKNIRERNRFVRGLVSWVGYRQIGVNYKREKRFAGRTKYPLRKMLKFAIDGISSFSFLPLRIASYGGFVISGLGLIYAVYAIFIKLFTTKAVPGWASLMVAILFLGGVQLIAIGIIGEYIARIGQETKQRPLYIIKEIIE